MTATVEQRYVAIDHPDEVVVIVKQDAGYTYVRHIQPPGRSLSPEGWDMGMSTENFEKWFAEASR